MGKVYVIGTCDTKADELVFARDMVIATGVPAVLVDVGVSGRASHAADIAAATLAARHLRGSSAVLDCADRGEAVAAMSEALCLWLTEQNDVAAVLGLGGSGNTALVTAAMRTLPVGLPKLMVSTVASGDVSRYVGPSDIAMMYSVTDVAGLNAISRKVIANAAHAIAGMAQWSAPAAGMDKPGVGLTMFGVTTACVTAVCSDLGDAWEPFVFHATGTGGQSMEKLVDSRLLSAIIDVTTTEVADYLMGGVFGCSDDRFGAISRSGVPYVGSVGALDMVNFGPIDTVPARYAGRRLHAHNAQVTLMRTSPAENTTIGTWIAERLNNCAGEIRFVLPMGGISAIDAPGMPFHDPEADMALFDAIRNTLLPTPRRRLIELPLAINDPAFAAALVAHFREIAQ